MWFLISTCEIPEKRQLEPADWLRVDRGIANLATINHKIAKEIVAVAERTGRGGSVVVALRRIDGLILFR